MIIINKDTNNYNDNNKDNNDKVILNITITNE